MKTAIELADEFPEQNLTNIEPDAVNLLNGWGLEAVAMLLQQAGQIEALTKQVFALTGEVANKADYAKSMYAMHQEAQAENEALLKANLDCVDHFNTLKTDYAALKADAERYRWLRKHVVFGYCSPEGCNSDDVYLTVTGYALFPKSGKTVDMAIDAMKGKS